MAAGEFNSSMPYYSSCLDLLLGINMLPISKIYDLLFRTFWKDFWRHLQQMGLGNKTFMPILTIPIVISLTRWIFQMNKLIFPYFTFCCISYGSCAREYLLKEAQKLGGTQKFHIISPESNTDPIFWSSCCIALRWRT